MIAKARFVVPVNSPVIENGAITFEEGRIVSIGSAGELTGKPIIDYGDAVILPGFVNAHTHLELSLLNGRVPPTPDFIDWLRRLIAVRSTDLHTEPRSSVRATPNGASTVGVRSPAATDPSCGDAFAADYVARAVRQGIAESVSSGVTTIGDITARPRWTRPVLAQSAVRAVSFGEVIGIGKGRTGLTDRLESAACIEHQTDAMRIGISPHAPYTVEPDGLRACAERARQIDAVLCIHVAETRDEEAFTRDRTGPLSEFLRELGVWDDEIPASALTPVELCATTGLLGPSTLLAHANYVSDADMATIASTGASVAYCPRTHAAFGHAPHRFRDMLQAGVNVCLGTDSLASNPSLSILDELRFLRTPCRDVASIDLLSMATIRGACALGFSELIGSLTAGKAADFVVIPLTPSNNVSWEEVLESELAPLAVYIAGCRRSGSFYC